MEECKFDKSLILYKQIQTPFDENGLFRERRFEIFYNDISTDLFFYDGYEDFTGEIFKIDEPVYHKTLKKEMIDTMIKNYVLKNL